MWQSYLKNALGYERQDEDEFEEAVRESVINTELKKKARGALKALIAEVQSGHLEYRLQEIVRRAKFTNLRDRIKKLL